MVLPMAFPLITKPSILKWYPKKDFALLKSPFSIDFLIFVELIVTLFCSLALISITSKSYFSPNFFKSSIPAVLFFPNL